MTTFGNGFANLTDNTLILPFNDDDDDDDLILSYDHLCQLDRGAGLGERGGSGGVLRSKLLAVPAPEDSTFCL